MRTSEQSGNDLTDVPRGRRWLRGALSLRARCVNYLFIGMILAGLVWCYEKMISPIFRYDGLVNELEARWPVIVGGALAIALSTILPLHCRRVSDYGAWILYLGIIVPLSVIPPYLGMMSNGDVLRMQVLVAGGFICMELGRRCPPIPLPLIPESAFLLRVVVPIVALAVVAIIFGMRGFKVDMSIGSDMYVRRVEARSLLPAGSLLAYGRSLAARAGVPFMVALSIAHRRSVYIPIIVFCVIGLISFDGQKSFLFGPILCLVFGWVAKRHARRALNSSFLVAATAALVGACLAEYHTFGSMIIAIEFVRRLFFMPAQLTVYYFDFFQSHPLGWMTDGVVGRLHLATPVYDLPLPQVIGANYFGNADTNANANFLASAYADFGAPGVLITGAMAGFFLCLIDSIVAQRPSEARFIAGVIIIFMTTFIWTEGSFHTSLLSDGALLSCFLLACFPGSPKPTPKSPTGRLELQTSSIPNN